MTRRPVRIQFRIRTVTSRLHTSPTMTRRLPRPTRRLQWLSGHQQNRITSFLLLERLTSIVWCTSIRLLSLSAERSCHLGSTVGTATFDSGPSSRRRGCPILLQSLSLLRNNGKRSCYKRRVSCVFYGTIEVRTHRQIPLWTMRMCVFPFGTMVLRRSIYLTQYSREATIDMIQYIQGDGTCSCVSLSTILLSSFVSQLAPKKKKVLQHISQDFRVQSNALFSIYL